MDHTRSTLLVRLRDRSDEQAWGTFDALYRTMLVGYARARGLSPADAEDVAQQCAEAVLEKIAGYAHTGSFKSWLRAIAEHKIIDRFRAQRREIQAGSGVLSNAADSSPPVDQDWDRQWTIAHLRYCARAVRSDVAENTYAAFVAYALEGRPARAVADELDMSPNQVYVAKHRVLDKIRAMMRDLLGEESEIAP